MNKKQVIISITIAILFSLFIGYGIEVFDDSPDYEDFCHSQTLYDLRTKEECIASEGEWYDNYPAVERKDLNDNSTITGSCNPPRDCYMEFDKAKLGHDQIVFIFSLIMGVIAVIASIFLKQEVISTGTLAGGVLVMLYGTIRYWSHANNLLKFSLIGVALAIVVWFTYKKLEKR